MSIKQKLLEIQKAVVYFQKDAKSYNFQYVSGNEVLSFIRPLMDKLQLLLFQSVKDIQIKDVEIPVKGVIQKKYMTTVIFEYTWYDCESDETLTVDYAGQGVDAGDKGYGMACTYSERYFLLKSFHAQTDIDDPDHYENNKNNVPAVKGKTYIDKKNELLAMVEKCKQQRLIGQAQIEHYNKLQADNMLYSDPEFERDNKNLNALLSGGNDAKSQI